MGNQTLRYFRSIIIISKDITKKEKDILVHRLKRKTLKKIGRKYKVSAERIRQIEKAALQKFVKKINQLLLFD